ncbi:MAG TPA: general stress protein CsbD [Bacteroidales bacterium]|nr:general stress protein CsbD [Bacteroidales bacterium]
MIQNINNLKPSDMNINVSGYWDKKKEKLKQKFPIITDEDLSYGEGKEKEMIELLGYKLGKSKQELLYIIVAI